MSVIYVTGDCHGNYSKFQNSRFPGQKEMTRDDVVIVCGDFGIWEDCKSERYNLDELSNRRFTTLFCDGNHECLHKDTDVLTQHGWVNIQKVVDMPSQYQVASVDLDTHQIHFDTPLGVVKKFAPIMIETQNANFKQCVTPKHDVIVKNVKMQAQTAIQQQLREQDFRVDVCAQHTDRIHLNNAQIELLTAVIMDATIVDYSKYNANSQKMRIQFHFKKPAKIHYIRELLDQNHFSYTIRNGSKDDTFICIYGDDARAIYQMIHQKKQFPCEWQNMTEEQFAACLNALQQTDGRRVKNVIVWRTTNYHDVNVISAAAILNGYDVSVDEQGQSGYTNQGKTQYRVMIGKNKRLTHYMQYHTIEYHDYAYCLTMPHGTLITRYKSCPAITGNCFDRLCTEEYVKYMRGEDITGADQGEFPLVDMYGGKVQKIRDGVYHLLRGEVYTINDKKFFVFGGAASHDISEGILDRADYKSDEEFYEAAYIWRKTKYYYRINHISWWKEEMPSEDEKRHAMEQLAKHDFKVDYIISHCAPTGIHCLMGYDSPDDATNFLQRIAEEAEFKQWFFGHYHGDRNINPEFVLMYNDIYPIYDTERQRFSCLGEIEPDER